MDHMVSISYGFVFTRLEEITEGADNNEDTHVESKVVAMKSKSTTKKKNQATSDNENTRESSNIVVKKAPL